jgi:hypothetical protein
VPARLSKAAMFAFAGTSGGCALGIDPGSARAWPRWPHARYGDVAVLSASPVHA